MKDRQIFRGIFVFFDSKKMVRLFYLLIFSLFFACGGNQGDNKIVRADIREVATNAHGRLELAGQNEDKIHILTVWGTPYEMGRAHGELLQKEIQSHVNNLIQNMGQKAGQPAEMLDQVFEQTRPFVPPHFLEELQGMADGSVVPLQD